MAKTARANPSDHTSVFRHPSGHTVVMTDQAIDVRDPDGEVQVRIELTGATPSVHLSGARLELESPEAISMRCRTFDVRATDSMQFRTEGTFEAYSKDDMRLESGSDARIWAEMIWLN